jgi:ubiquinone/menaquinone biosynthesis C-methylase UbiE
MGKPLYTTGATGYDDSFAHVTGLFVPAVLAAASLAPGQHVLDVATGTGEAAIAAAGIVGPSGAVVAGDISPAMLDVARRKQYAASVTFEQFDAHALPDLDSQFDAVICQLGLMFFADRVRALAEFRRVLRPEGRLAVGVSTTPERTLFLRVGTAIVRHAPSRTAAFDRYLEITDAERLRSLLASAGFGEIQVTSERRDVRFASFDDYFGVIERGATLSGQEFIRLPENVQRDVREDVRRALLGERPDGPLMINVELLVGSGRRS